MIKQMLKNFIEKIFSVGNKDVVKLSDLQEFARDAVKLGDLYESVKDVVRIEDLQRAVREVAKIEDVREAILHKNQHVLYALADWFPEGYYESFINEDLTEKYKNLIRGLDKESVAVINKVLSRIQKYARYKQELFEVSEEEYNAIERIRLIYTNGIELSYKDKVYAFGNYIIASNIYCASSLYYDCYVDEMRDRTKIQNNWIIDAGAFVGDSALVLSKYTHKGVIAFEPVASNYERMLLTLKINNVTNVIPEKKGLGDKSETLPIHIPDNGEVASSFEKIYGTESPKESSEVISVDEYVKAKNISIGFIKTDVEGFEMQLLHGSVETLKRDRPVLAISIYHTFEDFFSIKPWIESLGLGYEFRVVKPNSEDICCDVILLAEVPSRVG